MKLPKDPRHWQEPWRTEWHERAAIMEYDAGQRRDKAERQAEEHLREVHAAGELHAWTIAGEGGAE